MSIAAQVQIDEQSPWPGLAAFDERAERFFNGRDEEAAELRRLVLTSPLAVLFGISGLGKTSLLQAGLFPLLRRDHVLPVYVRLDYTAEEPLIDQMQDALKQEMSAHHVDAPTWCGTESLWEYLHHSGLELWSEQNHLLTPLFVLDQFEEAFTLGADHVASVAQFRRDLSDLVENRVPQPLAESLRHDAQAAGRFDLGMQRYKVLLSFREDYLPAVEGWKREVPSIMRNRLRLQPMTAVQAFAAVHETAPHLIDEELAKRIVDFVAKQNRTDAGRENTNERPVEPALLSLVCHGLNRRRLARGKARIDMGLLDETGSSIIADFYNRAVGGLRPQVRAFIETELITGKGFRDQRDLEDSRSRYELADEEITTLVNSRLLRIEPVRGSQRVELTHDLLTGVVLAAREERTHREKARLRRRRQLRAVLAAVTAIAAVITALVLLDRAEHEELARTKLQEENRLLAQVAGQRADLLVLDTILTDQTKAREWEVNIDITHAKRQGLQDQLKTANGKRADSLNAELSTLASLLPVQEDSLAMARKKALRAAAKSSAYFSGGRLLPFDSYSRLDLFDVRTRAVIARPSDTRLFGAITEGPEFDLQPLFFRDAFPPLRHVVDWRTKEPVDIGSVAVFAQHDGIDDQPPEYPWRAVSELALKVRLLRSAASDSTWATVVLLRPALPYAGADAHGDKQPLRSLGICLPIRVMPENSHPRPRNVAPSVVRSSDFRLELMPATDWGPRIVEIDAYADTTCSAPPHELVSDIASDTAFGRLRAKHSSSTIAISLVLEKLESAVRMSMRKSLEPPMQRQSISQALRAAEFLAGTDEAAWNQQQVRWARDIAALARASTGEMRELDAHLTRKLNSVGAGAGKTSQ